MASQPATRTHRSPTLQPQQLRASMPFHSWKRWRWRLSPCPRHTLQDITRFYTITCFRRLLGWHKRSLSAQLPTTVRNTAANRQTGLAQLALFAAFFFFLFSHSAKKKKDCADVPTVVSPWRCSSCSRFAPLAEHGTTGSLRSPRAATASLRLPSRDHRDRKPPPLDTSPVFSRFKRPSRARFARLEHPWARFARPGHNGLAPLACYAQGEH